MIEAALLLCLSGTVLAIFVPTFFRRVRTNMISEASEVLQTLSDRTRAYYETSWPDGRQRCLPGDAGPTPHSPSEDAIAVDFVAPDAAGRDSWEALGFQPERPVRFSYELVPERAGCGLGQDGDVEVVLRARGDLDGDGVLSTFERRATLTANGFQESETLLVHQRTE